MVSEHLGIMAIAAWALTDSHRQFENSKSSCPSAKLLRSSKTARTPRGWLDNCHPICSMPTSRNLRPRHSIEELNPPRPSRFLTM